MDGVEEVFAIAVVIGDVEVVIAVTKGFGALVHRVVILLYHLYRERLFLCSFVSYFRAL